ncbi:(4Fe-4S)-binding protein [Gemmatimonas aurantiaca]|uniref:(4Fe-4S)-binding protein n=1 Tax=Gemmatimonas aurantiaca TaxID=173480 RepID=UPI00301B8D4A
MHLEHHSDRFRLSMPVAAPPAEAWALLISPKGIAKWWGPHVSLDPQPGGALREVWRDDSDREVITSGTVRHHEPGHLIEFSWADDDWDASTTVRWSCEATPDGSIVHIEHAGWTALPASRREVLRQVHVEGWSRHLERFAALHELTREYPAQQLTVEWRQGRCWHSGNCVRALGVVFNPKRKPWIDTSGATDAEIESAVAKCPSGALRIRRNSGREL